MSSKLKRKKQEAKPRAPFSNMQTQHMLREFRATRQELDIMSQMSFDDGFNDGQDWSNIINSMTMMLALNELYGFGLGRMQKIIARMNQYTEDVNSGKIKVEDLVNAIHEKWGMELEDRSKDLLRRFSVRQ